MMPRQPLSPGQPPVLSVQGLTKRFGRLTALEGVTFALAPGSIVALLGANGAGKTTTFRCILGLTTFEGGIEVTGCSTRREPKEARRRTGYLPQTPPFDGRDRCEDVLNFLADLKGVGPARVESLLEVVHLQRQRTMRVSELSGGMQQRLALAAALLSDPPLLLLDEPTANLDLASRREFQALLRDLRSQGRAVLLSTHLVEGLSELADRVLLLDGGRVIMDAPMEELLRLGRDQRLAVNVNGTDPAQLMEALAGIGVGPQRVTQLPAHLEDIIERALAAQKGREGT